MDNKFLTEFNTGGNHEQNPLGGIPQGIGANGKLNTVEEGETKTEDYVFSDRLKLDDKLIKRYNLPKRFKGKTMADASKELNKSFKETNSKIDRETTEEMIGRLKNASEEARLTEELASLSDEDKANLEAQNQMMFGGPEELTEDVGEGPGIAGYMQAATGALELANTAFGKTRIDTSGLTEAPEVNQTGMAINSTLKGAQAGTAIMPGLGTAIGGAIGLGAGLIGGNKAKKDAIKAEKNHDLSQTVQYRNAYALGGNIDKTEKGKKKTTTRDVTDEEAVKEAEGSQFTPYGIKKLFGVDESTVGLYPDLNLGKYKDVNYFNPKQTSTGSYTLKNTKNNPANYALYKEQLNNIRKLNPELEFTNDGFEPLINQNKNGGYVNKYDNGGRPNVFSVNELEEMGIQGFDRATVGLKNYLNPSGTMSLSYAPSVNNLTPSGVMGQDNLESLNNNIVDTNSIDSYINSNVKNQRGDFIKEGFNKATNFLKKDKGEFLRYAPAVTNALQLANLDKPEQERLDRLDKRYKKDYVDEKQLVNRATSDYNSVANSLKNATNGSVGALRSNLLAAHLNKTKGLSDAFLQADNINRGENRFAQQFDNQNDRVNLQQSNTEKDWNARNKAAYDNNKSKFISALGNDLGNIGLEQMRKKYPERMDLLYNYLGKYRKEE